MPAASPVLIGTLLAGCLQPVQTPVDSRVPGNVTPVLASWFWWDREYEPHGYQAFLDMIARHSAVNVLTTSLRSPGKQVTDAAVRDQVREAAAYARPLGIRLVMDLDVRLAREAFRQRYPTEMQEMLRLREVDLKTDEAVSLQISSEDLSDHYTVRTTHYIPLSGRLVRVYAYERRGSAIDPDTIEDISAACRIAHADAGSVTVVMPGGASTAVRTACVMVAFTHLTPDVFAPHLLLFQREIIEQYQQTGLAGACKDEWGFSPCFDGNPRHDDYWYSSAMQEAYAAQSGGSELLRDCLLMTYGEHGRENRRQAAINRYMNLCRLRNSEIEHAFYQAVKAVFGRDAIVATHPTWWPYPDRREFKKNGLDWWTARRDWAQTDEYTPFGVRTALAKKWNSPVWFNMFYSPDPSRYAQELWSSALAGGRLNYHPLWPIGDELLPTEGYQALLRGGLMRGDCRVRLLNFITSSPLDCPVAVIFGHPGAMNWAGPGYDDVGMGLVDRFWRAGCPADLIPSTEIWNNALTLDAEGTIRYGKQPYLAVVLYHPELDQTLIASFFQRAAAGKTRLYRIGRWTRDFEGRAFDSAQALPQAMAVVEDPSAAAAQIIADLRDRLPGLQPAADRTIVFEHCRSAALPPKGLSRLLDGTHILVSGVSAAEGDPIQRTFVVDGHEVTADVVGLLALRFDDRGELQAMAAGGLKRLAISAFDLQLPDRIDLAFWRDDQGAHGVIQGYPDPLPDALKALTTDWLRLTLPQPYPPPHRATEPSSRTIRGSGVGSPARFEYNRFGSGEFRQTHDRGLT